MRFTLKCVSCLKWSGDIASLDDVRVVESKILTESDHDTGHVCGKKKKLTCVSFHLEGVNNTTDKRSTA